MTNIKILNLFCTQDTANCVQFCHSRDIKTAGHYYDKYKDFFILAASVLFKWFKLVLLTILKKLLDTLCEKIAISQLWGLKSKIRGHFSSPTFDFRNFLFFDPKRSDANWARYGQFVILTLIFKDFQIYENFLNNMFAIAHSMCILAIRVKK